MKEFIYGCNFKPGDYPSIIPEDVRGFIGYKINDVGMRVAIYNRLLTDDEINILNFTHITEILSNKSLNTTQT